MSGYGGPLSARNAEERFGSARFARPEEAEAAGLFRQTPGALLVGFLEGRPLYYDGEGGALLVAGARSGKLRDVLGYNICSGICRETMVLLDPKGEMAFISQDQTPDQKYCLYWNPIGLHGLPSHRINPVDFLQIDSPTLVADTKIFTQNALPESGSENGQYFERRAQDFAEAIILTLVKINGVLTLPDLYRAISLIPGGEEAWLDFAFEMNQSGFPIAERVEAEIAASRGSTSNGFQGILGELFKAFSALSDPLLLASISAPFDASLSDLCRSDQAYQLYLMAPAEFLQSWSPVIKAIFTGAQIYKARSPQAPRQTWILDECAQLGAFPLVAKLFAYGAGIGIRPWAVYQNTQQMNLTTEQGEAVITGSAALRSYFALRDLGAASTVSRMLGQQTVRFDDRLQQERAVHARRKAMQSMMQGGDPLETLLEAKHQSFVAEQQTKQQRALQTPDEMISMAGDRQVVFCDGLPAPLYAERQPYFQQRFMARRYLPNPYHPPLDQVQVMTGWGPRWRQVIKGPAPPHLAHYPQYRSHPYRRIE